jgi:hypothetical protein
MNNPNQIINAASNSVAAQTKSVDETSSATASNGNANTTPTVPPAATAVAVSGATAPKTATVAVAQSAGQTAKRAFERKLASDHPSDRCRPGITNKYLRDFGTLYADEDQAGEILGRKTAPHGIAIPYPGEEWKGSQVYRIRIANPTGGQKYDQATNSGMRIFVPKAELYEKRFLLLTEGEFKALASCEAGVPMIGLGGIWGFGKEKGDTHHLNARLAELIAELKPEALVFVGDADTGFMPAFSCAMCRLQRAASPTPLLLPRNPYHEPDGKGVDDIIEKIGPANYRVWFREALAKAISVDKADTPEELAMKLARHEKANLKAIRASAIPRAKEQVVALWASPLRSPVYRSELEEIVEQGLNWKSADFRRVAKEEAALAANGPAATQANLSVLQNIVVIDGKYHERKVDLDTGVRSKYFSPSTGDAVARTLQAAGFPKKGRNTLSLPGLGAVRNLSPLNAALHYVDQRVCEARTSMLFRPYGRIKNKDGQYVFNEVDCAVLSPANDVIESIDDPRISNTASYLRALLATYETEQLHHFLSVLAFLYKHAKCGAPRKTLALFLMGPESAGKSLLIDAIVPRIFGQSSAADAQALILRQNGGSGSLRTYVNKLCDRDIGDERLVESIAAGLISLISDHQTVGKLMYSNHTTDEVLNLFMLSSNPDGKVARILRHVYAGLKKKLAVYHCGPGLKALSGAWSPAALARPLAAIEPELPHFCSFLQRWSEGPIARALAEERFGVQPYYAKSVDITIDETDWEQIIAELLAEYSYDNVTARQVFEDLRAKHPETLKFIDAVKLLRLLVSLSRTRPDLVGLNETKTGLGKVKNRYFSIPPKAPKSGTPAESSPLNPGTSAADPRG